MKSKLKKIFAAFILMTLFDYVLSSPVLLDLGLNSLHVGLFFSLGLLLGPYGALGAVMGNAVISFSDGCAPVEIIVSAIFSFGISYLAYKLWYSSFKDYKITNPRFDNVFHLILFLSIMIICGLIYSVQQGNLAYVLFSSKNREFIAVSYLFNFVNSAFIYGIIGISLSKRLDFIETPNKSKRPVNKRLYRILFYLLMAVTLLSFIPLIIDLNRNIVNAEMILIVILLFAYLTKPFEDEIEENDENSVIEKIIRTFIIITLIIAIMGIAISYLSYGFVTTTKINFYIIKMPLLIIPDMTIILFFIPGIIILKYVEDNVIKPISAFSKIENFIKENEKIEAEGLVNIYSEYVNEQNEIGTLARSYTELINHNNNYIKNIREIEGEKERINAELDIATKIQASVLPIEAIKNDDFTVDGYSKPAREVGGDFFDYYQLDEDNLAMVIGDASGKGIPAALVAMVTQVIIKQMLKHERNPAKVLYSLNNQLSGNNPETMFLTLWIGIYNRTTRKITFSNAGHNPPLIRKNDEFRYLDIDAGIVLGILEDYNYMQEEITLTDELVLYTDGITDANNDNDEMYGDDRLLDFFNGFQSDDSPILPLLDDINRFTKDADQFDDMTLLYLRIT